MDTKIFKSLWGMAEGHTLEAKLAMIADAGYDGVETEPPDMEPSRWRDLCEEYGLEYIAAIYSLTPDDFESNLRKAVEYGPVCVNAQTGRDKYDFESGCDYFARALTTEAELGIPVAHETHRHRLLFTPWTTARYLERFPDLKICVDFSHWVLVTESRLADLQEVIALACSRALHVHARVGHEEAPQVSDPRAPEFAAYVELFERWWDAVRDARIEAREACMTITPEYGPPGYMQTLPYTQQPVAELWDVCLWAAERIRKRWSASGRASQTSQRVPNPNVESNRSTRS